ncbi:MAG: DUF1446 domain-containing protein [Desulfobacterales bacterium]|nr:DUF1446 domain-containing protein [Desulfobacterales bacterium]
MKDPNGGYVSTFLKQMEQVMGECLDKKIRVVANAGGLNPKGLAAELARMQKHWGFTLRLLILKATISWAALANFRLWERTSSIWTRVSP